MADGAQRKLSASLLSIGLTLIGSAGLVFAIPLLRYHRTELAIRDSDRLAALGSYGQASARLAAVWDWARCYPGQGARVAALSVASHVRSGNWEAALRTARRFYVEAPVSPFSAPQPGALARLRDGATRIVGEALTGGRPGTDNRWSGYEALVRELADAHQAERLADVSRAILALDPYSRLGLDAAATAEAELKKAAALAPAAPERRPAALPVAMPPPEPEPPPAPAVPPPAEPEPAQPDAPPAPIETPTHWAVVTNDGARAYDQAGHPIGALAPGTVLHVVRLGSFSGRGAAWGRTVDQATGSSNLLFATSDLYVRPVDAGGGDAQQAGLRSQLAALVAEESRLRKDLRPLTLVPTPEETAYDTAKAEYLEHQRTAEKLMADLDSSSGAERSAIHERLRQMKYEEIKLRGNLDQAKTALDASPTVSRRVTLLRQLDRVQARRLAITQYIEGLGTAPDGAT